MPRVPAYDRYRSGPHHPPTLAGLPPEFQGIWTTVEMFGADRARALQETGHGLSDLGDTMGRIAEDRLIRANALAARKAQTSTSPTPSRAGAGFA